MSLWSVRKIEKTFYDILVYESDDGRQEFEIANKLVSPKEFVTELGVNYER